MSVCVCVCVCVLTDSNHVLQHPFIKKSGDKSVIQKLLQECMPKIDANRENPPTSPPAAPGTGDKKTGTLPKSVDQKQAPASNSKTPASPPAISAAVAAAASASPAPATAAADGAGGTLKAPVKK